MCSPHVVDINQAVSRALTKSFKGNMIKKAHKPFSTQNRRLFTHLTRGYSSTGLRRSNPVYKGKDWAPLVTSLKKNKSTQDKPKCKGGESSILGSGV